MDWAGVVVVDPDPASACKGACSCPMRSCDAKHRGNRTANGKPIFHRGTRKFRAKVNRLPPSYLLFLWVNGLVSVEIVNFDQGHAGGVVLARTMAV